MIGPSSSHTAGALRIGKLAGCLFEETIERIDIYFYGSFAETYKGHGTDKALLGGILGFDIDDRKIVESLELTKKKGINLNIISKENNSDFANMHPNTAEIILTSKKSKLNIIGSSTGGGNIIISKVDEFEVELTGKAPTLWILHQDRPGLVAYITSVLCSHNININYMKVTRVSRDIMIGSSVIELDQEVSKNIIEDLEARENLLNIRYIPII